MKAKNQFLCTLAFLIVLKFSTAVLLSESQQVALESSSDLLPSPKQSTKIKEQLRAIRHFYPTVAHVHHAAAWVPGEIVVLQDELNSNIGVIKAINESKYGPLLPVLSSASNDDTSNEVVLSFERPYNGVVFSKLLEKQYNITTGPNFISSEIRNQISFVNSYPTYSTYLIKKMLKVEISGQVLAHYWQFTVAPSDTLSVTLEKEWGDDLSK